MTQREATGGDCRHPRAEQKTNRMENDYIFKAGERVAVIAGRHAGRNGQIKRMGSAAFSGYCYVTLDMLPREKAQKTEFIPLSSLMPEAKL